MDNTLVNDLLSSWILSLAAERKSPHTIKTYVAGVHAYQRWCQNVAPLRSRGESVEPDFSRQQVQEFTVYLLDQGREAATALSRQRGVKRFSAWLAEEGELPSDQLKGMPPPRLDVKVPGTLTDEQVKALLATCKTKAFHDVRDEALIRLMVESMVRASECLDMKVVDVDLRAGSAVVRRGKGGKGRVVPFGPQTARALDRYLRLRRSHPLASEPAMWLGSRGRPPLQYFALYTTFSRRGERAGFHFHPHQLRATGAVRWRERGGSIPSLLTIAGWTDLSMAQRYVMAAEARLAVEEHHRLGLGDFG
jgi:integrase/recombinase XerD